MVDSWPVAGVVKTVLSVLRAPGNALAFGVRDRVRWSRGIAVLPHEEKGELFEWLEGAGLLRANALAEELTTRFDLAALRQRSTRLVFAENLDRLEVLRRLLDGLELPGSTNAALRAVDVGCSSFSYATALQRYFSYASSTLPREVLLRGVEVDGFGIYRDGHSRSDHARAHAALAGANVHFHVDDFATMQLEVQDVVTMWFPFVRRYQLLQWGLPLSLFAPRQLFERAATVLRNGGLLVVVNQTQRERDEVDRLVSDLPFTCIARAGLESNLVPYHDRTLSRTGSVYRRD